MNEATQKTKLKHESKQTLFGFPGFLLEVIDSVFHVFLVVQTLNKSNFTFLTKLFCMKLQLIRADYSISL